jgi:hypothetical protein
MALSDDPWIAEHSTIDPERLHALGMITLWWNHCERNLLLIFCHIFGFTQRIGWIVGNDMGGISISNKISELLNFANLEKDIEDVIRNYLRVHDVCGKNRNTITHFTASMPKDKLFDVSSVAFVRMKGDDGKKAYIPSSLEDIRRIAEEIKVPLLHSWRIYKLLLSYQQGKSLELPPLVSLPEMLVKPPPQTVAKPKRPPRPSAAEQRRALNPR